MRSQYRRTPDDYVNGVTIGWKVRFAERNAPPAFLDHEQSPNRLFVEEIVNVLSEVRPEARHSLQAHGS